MQAYADYITMLELTQELIRAAARAATGSEQVCLENPSQTCKICS